MKENAAEYIKLQSALGKNLFQSFFAGVEAEIAKIKLATAALDRSNCWRSDCAIRRTLNSDLAAALLCLRLLGCREWPRQHAKT